MLSSEANHLLNKSMHIQANYTLHVALRRLCSSLCITINDRRHSKLSYFRSPELIINSTVVKSSASSATLSSGNSLQWPAAYLLKQLALNLAPWRSCFQGSCSSPMTTKLSSQHTIHSPILDRVDQAGTQLVTQHK